ncbi:hypothetical protein [Archangium sp.]|uniref:hypothetical protein n=1 Tax=Archangium sp. TaxID=1872627 RepID=UPI002D2681E6|nr:hypothetical protein [Archangium sp.]HYO51877.1 hypothetical protein [Archangium sp.]
MPSRSEGAVEMWVSTQPCARVPVAGPTKAHPHRYELEAGQRVFITLTGPVHEPDGR